MKLCAIFGLTGHTTGSGTGSGAGWEYPGQPHKHAGIDGAVPRQLALDDAVLLPLVVLPVHLKHY